MGRGHRYRAPPGAQRRARHRRVPAVHRPRRDQRHPALLREAHPQDQSAHHDRHHRPQGGGTGAHLLPGQEHHQLDQPGRRRGEVRAHLPASPNATARRWWWAPSTKTSCRRRPSRASANLRWRERSVPAADGEVRHPGRRHHHRPAGVPLRHRRRELHRRRGGDHRRHPAGEGEDALTSRPCWGFRTSRFGLPAAAREVVNSRLPLLLHQGRAGPGDRQRGEAGALRLDPRRRAPPRRNLLFNTPPVDSRRRIPAHRARGLARADGGAEGRHQPVPHRRHRGAFPPGREAREAARPRTCRSTSAWPTTSSKARRTA